MEPHAPAADLIGWASDWLLFYEISLATGHWLGGGIHLDTVTNNRSAQRHGARSGPTRPATTSPASSTTAWSAR